MKKRFLYYGLGLLATGAITTLLYAWVGIQYAFEVKRFVIGNKGSNKKIRILLLTDLHFGRQLWGFHYRLLRKIKALRPQLILIAGDLIDQHGQPEPARRFLQRLPFAVPLIAIQGNHDHKNKVSRRTLVKIIENNRGRLLINETVQIEIDNIPFTITGLDDFIEGDSNLTQAVKDIGKEEHHLLLLHSPLQQEGVLKKLGELNARRSVDSQLAIQYIFSGHTHGGQIRIGSFVPVLPKGAGNYVDGWYNNEKPYLYVCKGFGTSAVPFRLGARAEITLFEYGV